MSLIKDIIVYAILGAIQGFSEPIPISSSGHLVLFQSIFEKLGLMVPQMNDVTFEVIVNTGSLIAIMFYYRQDIIRLIKSFFGYIAKPQERDELLPDFRFCMLLIVATIPAAIGGVLFNDYIEHAFSNPKLVGCWDALRMGFFQLLALLPGVSRSGSTLTGGMLGGLDQKAARDFSFFMFMPVSFGAIILKLKHFLTSSTVAALWLPYLISFIVSGVVTYLALNLLFSILNKRKLNYFSYYCFIVGIIAILFL